MRRRTKVAALGLVTALPLAVLATAPHRLRVTRHTLSWPSTGSARIVHLTDLHVGRSTPRRLLDRAATQTRRADPDLVVLTGDYLNRTLKHAPALRRFLRRLPRPCVAVLGNHDRWADADEVQRILEEEGVVVLRNQSRSFSLADMELVVVGIDDGVACPADVAPAFEGLADPRSTLILIHRPEQVPCVAELGGRLVLAGHTHGGQIDMHRLTTRVMKRLGMPYVAGLYSVGSALLYVNAGIGSAFIRMRTGPRALPEVAVFELRGRGA